MERTRVNSSNLHSVGYFDNILEVQFLNNRIYLFSNVPENIYLNLMRAGSKGSYFSANIKDRYITRRIK